MLVCKMMTNLILDVIKRRVGLRARQVKYTNKSRQVPVPFELTPGFAERLWILQEGRCAYCNVPMTTNPGFPSTLSLDQVHPGMGYTSSNVKWACFSCNHAKHSFSVDQHMEHLRLQREHFVSSH